MRTQDEDHSELLETQELAEQYRSDTDTITPDTSELGQSHPGDGRSISRFLRLTPSAIQVTAAVMGLLLGTALSLTIFLAVPSGSVLGKLFNLHKIQGVLPLLMLGMFFWGICLCFIRQLRTRAVEKYTDAKTVAELSERIASVPLKQVLAQLDGSELTEVIPLLRRVRIVLRQWSTKPSLQDAISLLDQQAISDTEEIHHAHGVAKTFVWALPVLGLIGTVLGIALAVGNFGQLIGGNVDDVEVIKNSLVHVTSGLSFAFTTTLLGLLGSLLLVLPSSSLQSREEKLVTRTESIITEHLLPQLQRLYPERTQHAGIPDTEELRQTLTEVAETAVNAAGIAANKLLEGSQERFAEWQRGVEEESRKTASQIFDAAQKIGTALATTSDEFLARISLFSEAMDRNTAAVQESIVRSVASSQAIADKLDSTMEKHDRAAAESASLMKQLCDASDSLLQSHAALLKSVEELSQGDLAKTLESLAQTMKSAEAQYTETHRALDNMTETTQRLASCQESLQANLQRMEDMGLTAALSDLGRTLEEVSGVLKQFQEPVVFQAVRASTVMHNRMATSGGTDVPAGE